MGKPCSFYYTSKIKIFGCWIFFSIPHNMHSRYAFGWVIPFLLRLLQNLSAFSVIVEQKLWPVAIAQIKLFRIPLCPSRVMEKMSGCLLLKNRCPSLSAIITFLYVDASCVKSMKEYVDYLCSQCQSLVYLGFPPFSSVIINLCFCTSCSFGFPIPMEGC